MVGCGIEDRMHLQAMGAPVPVRPAMQLAERDRRGVENADHLRAIPAQLPIRQTGQHGEGLSEHRWRTAMIGVGQCRARDRPRAEMIMMMGVGVPGLLQPAQAVRRTQLGEDQRQKVVPTREALIVGIAIMGFDNGLEPPPRERFEKAAKDAIPIAHARLHFLSLTTRK